MTPQSSTMAEQEGGWPLGLQRLNRRVSLARSLDMSGSRSFSTLLTSTTTFAYPATTCSLSSEAHSLPYSVSWMHNVWFQDIEGANHSAASTIHLSRRSFSSSMRGNAGVDCGGFGTPSPPLPQLRSSSGAKHAIKKRKLWFCCFCLKRVFDDEDHNHGTTKTTMTKMNPQISLGHLLEEERIRAMGIHRRPGSNVTTCITS